MTIRRSDIVFFFALALGLYVAWQIRDVLLMIYVSILFAVVIQPAINAVRRLHIAGRHPGRAMAVTLILLAGLIVMALFSAFALPPIFRDIQAAGQAGPHRVTELMARLQRMPFASRYDFNSLQQNLDVAIGGLFGLFRGIANGLFWFFSWLILTAYFIADGERAFAWFMSLFPVRQRERLQPTLLRAEARVRNWLLGQVALMLCLGVCSGIVFGFLHVRYFYALAVFAAAANIVPIVGPVASCLLAAGVAAWDSWPKLAGVLIFYCVYQQFESGFLTPRIMKSTLDLPPLAVIVALTVGGTLAGVLGALVAVPTAALVAVLADEYLVKPHQNSESRAAIASSEP